MKTIKERAKAIIFEHESDIATAFSRAFALVQEIANAQTAPEPEPGVPDGLIQNLVQTAMRGLLTADDMANLRRFDECCQDSDADGHAVAKPKMKRLELAGVVRSCGFGRHETTAFGDWLLADAPEQPTSVPVLTVECEPDYWSGGHYYEGTKPHIAPTAVWKLPIGTKLYTSPPANNQSEQHLEMVNAPAPSVPDEQLQAAFDRGLKAGNEQAIAQQIEIHKLHDLLAVQQPEQPADPETQGQCLGAEYLADAIRAMSEKGQS